MVAVTKWVQPTTAIPTAVGGISVLTSNVIDLGGYTAADTFDLFTVPAGSMILAAKAVVIETAGETCTIDVGVTGGDVDGVIDGFDVNQAVGYSTSVSGDDVGVGVLFDTATLISALAVTGSTYAAGKFQVTVVISHA